MVSTLFCGSVVLGVERRAPSARPALENSPQHTQIRYNGHVPICKVASTYTKLHRLPLYPHCHPESKPCRIGPSSNPWASPSIGNSPPPDRLARRYFKHPCDDIFAWLEWCELSPGAISELFWGFPGVFWGFDGGSLAGQSTGGGFLMASEDSPLTQHQQRARVCSTRTTAIISSDSLVRSSETQRLLRSDLQLEHS